MTTINVNGIEYELVPIIKKEYNIGDWVIFKFNEGKEEIRKIISNDAYNKCVLSELYGYNNWMCNSTSNENRAGKIIRKATTIEIQVHLTKLALSKNYKKGIYVTGLLTNVKHHLDNEYCIYLSLSDEFYFNNICIYKNGNWAKIIPQEKVFTFGGENIKIEKVKIGTSSFYYTINCKNEIGRFVELQNIILEPFKENSFGNVKTKSLQLNSTIIDISKCIKYYNQVINKITIGCLTGTYQELLNIYNRILELDNNKK